MKQVKNIHTTQTSHITFCALCLGTLLAAPCIAADWRDFNVQLKGSNSYSEPGTPGKISKVITTFEYSDAYALGQNFAYIDVSQFGKQSVGAVTGTLERPLDFFGEYHHTLSLQKALGTPLQLGPIQDVGVWTALIAGTNNSEFAPSTKAAILGLSFSLPARPYGYQAVKLGAYKSWESNVFGDVDTEATYRLAYVWGLPFTAMGVHWSFEGYGNYTGITAPGRKPRFYAQPSLLADISPLIAQRAKTLEFGLQYLYDHNKFGSDTRESAAQLIFKWHL